jgi:hypothetical protein
MCVQTNDVRCSDKNIVSGYRRLQFWEIDVCFRCPMVGMCLTEAEQITVVKKAGLPVKDKTPFDIHELLVASAGRENQLSVRINMVLSQKYSSKAGHLLLQDEQTFLEQWRESFQSGDYLAAFWAAASRPDLSPAGKLEVFGAIHMSMHATAQERCRDKQCIAFLQNECARHEEKVKTLTLMRRQLQKKQEELEQQHKELKAALHCASKENGMPMPAAAMPIRLVDTGAEVVRLRQTVEEKTHRIESLERRLVDLEESKAKLSLALRDRKEANVMFHHEAEQTLQGLLAEGHCSPECPSFDLCQKRILIVGGIARMEAHYRRMIEEGGGVLEYHEGHMKGGGTRQLESSLKRADIILCPVNCNSHAACLRVKNLGKKHKKPVHMLANFSLSAVSQALNANGN